MFGSKVVTSVDRTSFNFWFEDCLSYLTWCTIIYCVTDQLSITRSRRSVLNFKLSVLTFSKSMSCLMSIEQKLCKVKKIQLQSMSNAMRCFDHRFVFKNSGFACLALIFNLTLSYLRSTILHQKNGETPKVMWRVTYCFFQEINTSLYPSAEQRPFCVALSPSVHRHASSLYRCALYNFFSWISSVAISHWQGFNS